VIAEEEDLKASSETDKNVSEMGFELNLDAVRAKYGEGWEKKAPAPAQPPALPGRRPATVPVVDNEESDGEAQESVAETQEGATASFAEPGERDAIDDAVDEALVEWEEVITPITDPVLAAIADAADAGETAEQVLQRISALLAAENAPDAGPLAERLAQLAGAARLAGAAGADA
jgi:hypothetical protein